MILNPGGGSLSLTVTHIGQTKDRQLNIKYLAFMRDNFKLLLRMFASPEWLFMRLQEQVATVFLPGFASASTAALMEFLRKGEVSVAHFLTLPDTS